MDCAESLGMLSDFRDGSLEEQHRSLVSQHLSLCPPCMGVFQDIESIIVTAGGFRTEDGISYPDENTVWERITITKRTVH